MRLAIVHDYLNQMGGAERCVEAMHQIWPEAPIYTTLFTPQTMAPSFGSMDIKTTWMQHLPGKERHFKKYLMLYPKAISGIDLDGYDLILSSSSGWAKGVRIPKGALHICYCYTPMRWVWNYDDYVAREGFSPMIKRFLPLAIRRLKAWDLRTTAGIHEIIAISDYVKRRIQLVWGRDSSVIYPPVDCSRFRISEPEDYFLVVSRLNTYKKIEIAVEACSQLDLPLKIIGSGPHEEHLKNIAGPNVQFLGRLDDTTTADYFSRCRAFIFPGKEDFGITPVEAQAAGRPVIAFAGGGALETVVEGETGTFFDEPSVSSLKETIKRFNEQDFDPQTIRANAMRFDTSVFAEELKEFVDNRYAAMKVKI